MMKVPHVTVIGSLNIDFVTFTLRCPKPGETLSAISFSVSGGGKGANQAIACARASFTSKVQQDVRVSMIGAVGADDPNVATYLKPALEASGVNTKYIEEQKDCQTGSATVIVEQGTGAENRILIIPGANHSGMNNDFEKILATVQNQHCRPGVIVLQGEIPRLTVQRLLQHFNQRSDGSSACSYPTYIIFNAAPVFPEGISLAALADTAVLIMNETEASQMSTLISASGIAAADQTVPGPLRVKDVARQFHDIVGIKIVLITLGAKGVFYSTKTGRQGQEQAVRVNKVVDTTAAGDTFVGYFASQFAKYVASRGSLDGFDDSIEEVIRRANFAASICVQQEGALQSIPFAYEIYP